MRAAPKLLLLLSLAGGALLSGGCAMNKEDQGYYTRGWLWPKDLDDPEPKRRPLGEPSRSTAPGGLSADSGW